MVSYVVLWNWTEQGISKVQDTVKRAASFAKLAKKFGAEVRMYCWTIGTYDGLVILDAPDEVTAVGLLAKLGAMGNIQTQSLRSFNAEEMREILAVAK